MANTRYRVLAVAPHPVQYAAPIFRRMAQNQLLDFQVAYCSLRGAQTAHDPEFDTAVKWDIPLLDDYSWTYVPNRGSGTELFWGLCNPGLWRLIRSGNFDAVLCYTGYRRASFWISYLAAKSCRASFIFGADSVTLTPRDGRMWKTHIKRIIWPLLFRLADQVIVPSSGSRDLMLFLGVREDRVTLTPYVVDNDWWTARSSSVDRTAVRASWGVSMQDFVVLFCAKLQPWKRPFDLLRAFAHAGLPKARLVFAGEGPLRSRLEDEAAASGLMDRVQFLGFVNQSQLPAVYKACDVMVLPSQFEPFAVVVNEAMCCGCPVVASDRVGSARDLIAPIASDFVFPCGDTDALAGILSRLYNNRVRLQEASCAAVTRMQSWNPEYNVNATVEAISQAAFRTRGSLAKPTRSSSASASDSPTSGRRA